MAGQNSFKLLTSYDLDEPAIAQPFLKAVHTQIVANGGTKYTGKGGQEITCKNNFAKLLRHGFWTAFALQTPESPVTSLVLLKQGRSIDNRPVVRVEDIVTQPELHNKGYGKIALAAAGAVALNKYKNPIVTGECESAKPYGAAVYTKVGGRLTALAPVRFGHQQLQELRASAIFGPATSGTRLNVVYDEATEKKPIHLDLNSYSGNDTIEKIAMFHKDRKLPPSYKVFITKGGDIIAEAAKQDRASIIRTATYDFNKPAAAETNESPIGSQIDSFKLHRSEFFSVPLYFRVMAQLVTEPQTSRHSPHFKPITLEQSFCDVAIEAGNRQHQRLVDEYGLDYNSYATAEESAQNLTSYAQIYWEENPKIPDALKPFLPVIC